MPYMNGATLAHHISKLQPDIAVVYMSGHTGEKIKLSGINEETILFVEKPFSQKVLLSTVHKCLENRLNSRTVITPFGPSMQFAAEQAPQAEAIVVNGMPNFRRKDHLPQRIVSLDRDLEAKTGKPVVSSDTALYWRMFKTLGVSPTGTHGRLLSSLQ